MTVTFQAADLLALLPILILSFFGCAALGFEVFARRGTSRAFVGTIAAIGFALALWTNHGAWSATEAGFSQPLFGGMIVADAFGTFFNIIIFGAGLLTVVLSRKYLATHKIDFGEYYSLVLFAAVGMSLLAASHDLIVLFIALEVMSIAVYVLTAFLRSSKAAAEAGLKYFLMGAFASGFLLYGVALLYGATGSTDIVAIRGAIDANATLADSNIFKLGMVFVLIGMAFKIAVAPFHLWTPDVYEGAPAPVTAFMAVGVKAAGFAGLIRLLTIPFGVDVLQFGDAGNGWVGVMYFLAILTMFGGNLGALGQTNVKRMLAYSSISHAGYLLIGVVGAATGVASESTSAMLFYLLAYTFSTFLVFGVLALFGRDGEEFVHTSDFAGIGFRKPFLGLALMLGLLSLAGIPPLGGFFAKFYMFREAMTAGTIEMVILVVVGVVNSMIALYYYLRVIVFLYMKEPTREVPVFNSNGAIAVLAVSLAIVIALGVFPDEYIELARRSFASLGG